MRVVLDQRGGVHSRHFTNEELKFTKANRLLQDPATIFGKLHTANFLTF